MTTKINSTGELIAVERCKTKNNDLLDEKMRIFANLIIDKILVEEKDNLVRKKTKKDL